MTNCSDGGVLGMVPGLIGQIQAMEVVKIVLGFAKENILTQRMIIFDARSMTFRNCKIRGRNKDCIACGEHDSSSTSIQQQITDVSQFDYADFCKMNCDVVAQIQLPEANRISIEDFAAVYQNGE